MEQSHKEKECSGESFYIFFIFLGTTLGALVGIFIFRSIDNYVLNYVTALGSIGTLGTLLFLMYDGINNRKVTAARDSRQEEMWTFHKYQMHRKLFDELLDQMEDKHAGMGLKFYNRTKLYLLLFPKNTVNYVQLESNTIVQATQPFEQEFNELFDQSMGIDPLPRIVELHSHMFSKLFIGFTVEAKLGQIIYLGSETYFNLFTYNEHIQAWQSIVDELNSFSNSKGIERDTCRFYRLSESEFVSVIDSLLCDSSQYSILLGDIDMRLFEELWRANKQIKSSLRNFTKRASNNGFSKPLFICHPLFDLFTEERLRQLEVDNDFRLDAINKFLSSLDREILKDNHRKRYLEGAKQRLLALSEELTESIV
jgi:hypothetical protein